MHKLAILADIHGNFAALEAVAEHIDRWQPDAVVVAGDIVNRGPRSLECLRFVLDRAAGSGWQVIRGNHEEYVLRVTRDPGARPGLEGVVRDNIAWTARQLGEQMAALDTLPTQISLRAPDGARRAWSTPRCATTATTSSSIRPRRSCESRSRRRRR